MAASRVLVVQHIACETLGGIEPSLQARQLAIDVVRVFAHERLPAPAELGQWTALIVMGGSMGVYEQDRFPFLRAEVQLLREAVTRGMPVLGVCLGSQLLAAALGAAVKPSGFQEIGWKPVVVTTDAASDLVMRHAPSVFTPCHWHGDIFDLPPGAVRLASSTLTKNQVFRYGLKAYGILFHLELTAPMIADWLGTFASQLTALGLAVEELQRDTERYLTEAQQVGRLVFDAWAGLVDGIPPLVGDTGLMSTMADLD